MAILCGAAKNSLRGTNIMLSSMIIMLHGVAGDVQEILQPVRSLYAEKYACLVSLFLAAVVI
jgi:hypothetical protein